MVAFGDDDLVAVGISMLVLAGVCRATAASLVGAERLVGRRRVPPPDPGDHGHDPEPPRFVRRRREDRQRRSPR